MILKLLVLIGVIAIIYFFFIKKKPAGDAVKKTGTSAKKEEDNTMVPCDACGVYISVDEALIKEGRYFCSKSCLEQS